MDKFDKSYLTAIELNSIYSSILVCSINKNSLDVVGYDKVLTNGFSDGRIVDSLLFKNTISLLKDEIKRKFKIDIYEAIVVLPNNNHKVYTSEVESKILTQGWIISNKEINDIRKEIKNKSKLINQALIDEVPTIYALDGNKVMRTPPVGYKSPYLKVTSDIHALPFDLVKSYVEEFNKSDIKVIGCEINADCNSTAVSKDYDLEESTIIIDVGQDVTTIAAYSKQLLKASSRVNFGIKNIIEHIATIYNVSFVNALEIFDSYYVIDEKLCTKVNFDNDLDLSELKLNQSVRTILVNGINLIKDEAEKLEMDLNFNNCSFKLTGLLNSHEGFVNEFLKITNFDVKEENIKVPCIDSNIYKNVYGAIKKYYVDNIDMLQEIINSDANELVEIEKPLFVLERKQEEPTENKSHIEIENKNEIKKSAFRDFFDD